MNQSINSLFLQIKGQFIDCCIKATLLKKINNLGKKTIKNSDN